MSADVVRKPYRMLSREVWAEIRRQYLAGSGPAEICRRFGVARSTLTTKRSVERWDEQRAALQQIRERRAEVPGDSALRATALRTTAREASASENRVAPEPHPALAAEAPGDSVRTEAEDRALAVADAMNSSYLELAGALRNRLDRFVLEDSLGATSSPRPSRDVLDAAAALEKLQRIERTALGIEARPKAPSSQMVIILPPKLSPDDWQRHARLQQASYAECDMLDSRPSSTEGGGRVSNDDD